MMAAPPDAKRPAPSVADGSGAEADHAGKLISSAYNRRAAWPQIRLLLLHHEPSLDGARPVHDALKIPRPHFETHTAEVREERWTPLGQGGRR